MDSEFVASKTCGIEVLGLKWQNVDTNDNKKTYTQAHQHTHAHARTHAHRLTLSYTCRFTHTHTQTNTYNTRVCVHTSVCVYVFDFEVQTCNLVEIVFFPNYEHFNESTPWNMR